MLPTPSSIFRTAAGSSRSCRMPGKRPRLHFRSEEDCSSEAETALFLTRRCCRRRLLSSGRPREAHGRVECRERGHDYTSDLKRIVHLKPKQRFFSQGDVADAVFYLQDGRGKLTVVSNAGKEATITLPI